MPRVLARVADAFYSLGPALVFVAFGVNGFAWSRWPVFVLALAAQFSVDAVAGLARSWYAEGIAPSRQLPMLWLYVTDACLSCVGLVIAASAARHAGLVMLALPLVGILWLLARERARRLDCALALSTAYRGTAALIGHVAGPDDRQTGAPSNDVVDLSRSIAEVLRLDGTERRILEFVAMLHNVGKLSVPKEVLLNPAELDDRERESIRRDTLAGEQMLQQLGGAFASVERYVRASHEHYDGRGYPDGLAGERIPLQSRIVSVCNAFSAMTTDRPYRAAMPVGEAISELRRCAGSQFDPRVVSALERVAGPATEYPRRGDADDR
jgi:HD-GYP domain-containing protein (c-di-GMP phosphodiesterase class II)